MRFKKQILRPVDYYPICDECGEILLENNKIMQRGCYVYTCPHCQKNYYLNEKYPKRIWEKNGAPIIVQK